MAHVFMAFHALHWVLHIINTCALWLLKPRGTHCFSSFLWLEKVHSHVPIFAWLLSLLTSLDLSQDCIRHTCFLEGSESYSNLKKKKPRKMLTLRQIPFCCSLSLRCLVVDSPATNPVAVYCEYLRSIYKRATCQGNGAARDTLCTQI